MYTFLLSEFVRLSKFELERELPQTTDQSKVFCPDSDIGSLVLGKAFHVKWRCGPSQVALWCKQWKI